MATRKKGGDQKKLHCSFCGKEQEAVRRFVAGPGVYICDECIDLCNEIIAEDAEENQENVLAGALPRPVDIKKVLDQHVIGQDEAKKALAVAVYNHYKRIRHNQKKGSVELDKSNILLIGPTGSGKTLLAQTLARLLNVPFAIVDATALTEAGYVGEDVENILLRLIQNAGGDIKKAEVGIIYVDEIDKISRKTDGPSITRDVSGEGVQQALLKIIEGTVANVPPQGGRKHPHQDFINLNTRNILFICGGAFVGLDHVLEQRLGRRKIGFGRYSNSTITSEKSPPAKSSPAVELKSLEREKSAEKKEKREKREIGSSSNKKEAGQPTAPAENDLPNNLQDDLLTAPHRQELFANILPDDLMKYGLIPEFVGRFPIVAVLNNLNSQTLQKIFVEPKNSLLKQYQKNFDIEGVKLKFTNEAIKRIAEKSIKRGVGARGLRSIIENTMMDLMYHIPSRQDVEEIVITPGVVENNDPPVLVLKKERRKNFAAKSGAKSEAKKEKSA